jgi:hypothetical protein
MDHPEAHERIADLILEPRALAAFEDDPSPEAAALRGHVERCAACRAELDGWRRTHAIVLSGLAAADPDEPALAASLGDVPLQAPASLRATVAAIPGTVDGTVPSVVGRDARGAAHHRPAWRRVPAVAAVALLLVAGGTAGLAFDQARRADIEQRRAVRLETLSTSMDRLLGDPDHASTVLLGVDGSPAGTATWTAEEIVVLTTALERPPEGFEYRCWIERDGVRRKVGVMWLGDDIAYWWGDLDPTSGLLDDGEGRIGISLEAKGAPGGGPPVLLGDLPT